MQADDAHFSMKISLLMPNLFKSLGGLKNFYLLTCNLT